jgi:sialidase-1
MPRYLNLITVCFAITGWATLSKASEPDEASPPAADFERVQPGSFRHMETPLGTWTAKAGHAEIDSEHARTGDQCLRIRGGDSRTLEVEVKRHGERDQVLTFWAERWTARPPFKFRLDQWTAGKWTEIYNGDEQIKVGGFLTHVRVPLKNTQSYKLRFRLTAPETAGLLIDDVRLVVAQPLVAVAAQANQPVLPALVGAPWSAITRLRVDVGGNSGSPPVIETIRISTAGTTDLADIAEVQAFYTGSQELVGATKHANCMVGAVPFGKGQSADTELELNGKQTLSPGPNYFWIAYQLDERANIDHRVNARIKEVSLGEGRQLKVQTASDLAGQRMGIALRRRGDEGIHTYRIPGLATTSQGTLIAVYDVRRRGGGDLPGDIDVGLSRSTDGGRSWEGMRIVMDMGNDPSWQYDGVGDPAVLVDRKTKTIWVAATWSHGNRAWHGSGPGMTPAETGQLMLVRSDDDGRTWSRPINITAQVKAPEWAYLLQGPGKGITMADGTLVFAAQFQDTPANDRLPRSTILYSRDNGETWNIGTGAFDDTTEAQVVEIEPGVLMLNCRYNREPRRVVMITRDMGQTWQEHPTSRQTLIEPRACMASLIGMDQEVGQSLGRWLLFSNPHSTRLRQRMTIKASNDRGITWPKAQQLLLDEGDSAGYSCMSMIDRNTVGILYEGSQAHMTFQRVPVEDITAEAHFAVP